MKRHAHGSFAFAFRPEMTLISAEGAWNQECAELYTALIRTRVESHPDQIRCVIIDGRRWGLKTPESGRVIQESNRFISGYYKALYVAYLFSPENVHLGRYIIDADNRVGDAVLHWDFFLRLDDALSWLRSQGFDLPDVADGDFPDPVPAEDYRHLLED